jgi:DNA (cytosine-5)-methyltransferase 1
VNLVAGSLAAHDTPHGHGHSGFACNQSVDANHIVAHTLRGEGFDASEDGTGRGTPLVVNTLTSHHGRNDASDAFIPVAFDERQITSPHNRSNPKPDGPCHTLHEKAPSIAYQCHGSNVGPMGTLRRGSGNETSGVPFLADTLTANWARSNGAKAGNNAGVLNPIINRSGVRRLTPRECERLQGFPDDWTRWTADDRELADSARYRMCGNAVAVPVAHWIGRRIVAATQ